VKLPLAVDPLAPRFRCPVNAANLTVNSCGNRHHVARTTPDPERRLQLSRCGSCVVGVANLAGLPMPSLDLITMPKEGTAMSSSAETTEPKTWKDRVCARDKTTVFSPAKIQQKACGTCDKCLEAEGPTAIRPKPNGKKPNGNGKHRAPVLAHRIIAERRATPIASPAPAIDHLAGARELLESIGYAVREISTPAGPRLLVGAA
jgi:hypothetical protein